MGDAKVKYIKLLKEAVRMFYAQDAAKLLRGADGRSACERCVVNCIARYLWCLIQQRGLAADVDVEYNLDCKSEDYKRIHASMCMSCTACWMNEFLMGRVLREKKDDGALLYPDLIVHVRGTNKNYLAVEFKKKGEAVDGDGHYTNAAKWDFAKLKYFSCVERREGIRRYDEVVFVILKEEGPEFILPKNFPKTMREPARG